MLTKRHKIILAGQLIFPELWHLGAIADFAQISEGRAQGCLAVTKHVVAEEVDNVQSPSHVDLQATVATEQRRALEVHVGCFLRLIEGENDWTGNGKAQAARTHQELEDLEWRDHVLDQNWLRTRLETLCLSRVHWRRRLRGATLEDALQDVARLCDMIQDFEVLGGGNAVRIVRGWPSICTKFVSFQG